MKVLNDYSFIRGVCHNSPDTGEHYLREISYARKIGINSFRTWMSPIAWEKDPAGYEAHMKAFISIAWESGISVMPILFNGNMMDPGMVYPGWKEGLVERYTRAMVRALKGEPGLLMWDIMNEPSCNDWLMQAGEEYESRWSDMNQFLSRVIDIVREEDAENAVTIGHTWAKDLMPSSEWVDVISFHDYLESRERIEATYDTAEELGRRLGKPLINSELCCTGRANPYDLALQIAYERKVGFYAFELMIRGYWGDIHGLFYPDGTVRDPATVAAMMGLFRKKTPDRIRHNANKEGKANEAIERIRRAMTDHTKTFEYTRRPTDELLEAMEWAANILECCELVPMIDPPTAKIIEWRMQDPDSLDVTEIRRFAYHLVEELRKNCQII